MKCRRTKIVCTIGPVSDSLEVLCELLEAGMDVARLNMSHGSREDHRRRIADIRAAACKVGRSVAIMLDTQGPEIRTGVLRDSSVILHTGSRIILTTESIEGTAERVGVTYAGLPHDVKAGSTILIDDGLLELKVDSCTQTEVHCTVIHGGVLGSRKGINIPGVSVSIPSLTDKDKEDLLFGIEEKVDFVAASFVRKSRDVLDILNFLEKRESDIDIIAKIETQESVENAESIIEVADGLMVARGDLGVEIAVEKVPIVQKELIRMCNRHGKPVITATQMLDSMQRHPRPTRAEASDVANAILDGTDAVMLSGETASGAYPVHAVKMMSRIALRAEADFSFAYPSETEVNITDALSDAVVRVVNHLDGEAILTATESGCTARTVAKYRPRVPIIAVTPNEEVIRKLQLVWGVYPVWGKHSGTAESMLQEAVSAALSGGYVKHGSLVIVTAGVPLGRAGTTNLFKVHVVGGVLARGRGIGARKIVTGQVILASSTEDLRKYMLTGAIVVISEIEPGMEDILVDASVIISESTGISSPTAKLALKLGIPAVIGVTDAMKVLKNERTVTIDIHRGHIFSGSTQIL